jgi:hypothetical protein
MKPVPRGNPDWEWPDLPAEPVVNDSTQLCHPWEHPLWRPFLNADGLLDRGLALRCRVRRERGIELSTSGLDAILLEQLLLVEVECAHADCPSLGRRQHCFRAHNRYGERAWGPIPSLTVATACPSTGLARACSRGLGASAAAARLRLEIERVRAEFSHMSGVI